jgi:hypothetical protein
MSTDKKEDEVEWEKMVDWSYQTSPNAVRFGFRDVGCWTVNLHDRSGKRPPKAISGHPSKEAALDAAFELSEPWSALQQEYAAAEEAAALEEEGEDEEAVASEVPTNANAIALPERTGGKASGARKGIFHQRKH